MSNYKKAHRANTSASRNYKSASHLLSISASGATSLRSLQSIRKHPPAIPYEKIEASIKDR